MKKLVLSLCALSLFAGSAPSFAATQCRDKNGKFIECKWRGLSPRLLT
jgi:hypothetical protein